MREFWQLIGSIVLGFFLMAPLGMLFDKMNWGVFHTWGLAHGSFILAWPALTVINFIAMKALHRLKHGQSE